VFIDRQEILTDSLEARVHLKTGNLTRERSRRQPYTFRQETLTDSPEACVHLTVETPIDDHRH
jgi:hypothetical protein